MQVNKMGGQALDEAASSPPILCLILVVRRTELIWHTKFQRELSALIWGQRPALT